jgi:2-C-methyl-D-erythritol 2,4-cyclodiphosphate synthase
VRIGQGVDVHRRSDDPQRELWLGLVRIPGAPGLQGHSDADVATHALCDALLGAASLGDLGRQFPDSDPATADIASSRLLASTVSLVHGAGWRAVSADVTIIAEQPRLSPFMDAMSAALSAAVGAPVSVKATTAEGLGALGRVEGIGALAVALVEERV